MIKQSLIFLLVFSSSVVQSQSVEHFGLKVGVVSSNSVVTASGSYYGSMYKDSRVSGSFSFFAQFLKSEFYKFEIELGYKQEGAEDKIPVTTVENPDGSGQHITLDHAYDFISLNLSFQPKFESEDISLYGIIAPTLNYMIKNRDMVIHDEEITKLVLGYIIGLGFQPKNLMKGKLFVEVKFGSSFSEYLKNEFLTAKFNTWHVTIGSYIN